MNRASWRRWGWVAVLAATALWPAGLAAQATSAGISGVVVNGTTHRAAGGVKVALFAQGALQDSVPIQTVKANAAGHFRLPAGNGAMVLRATYRGVHYWQPAPNNGKPVRITVYDLAPPSAKFQVQAQVAVVQPENSELAVVDEYIVQNPLHRTLYRPGGLFRFRVPRNIQPDGAHVIGPDGVGLTLNAQPTPKYAGEYTVAAPIRPGETRIQVSYRIPYATQQANLTEQAVYPTGHFMVYVPQAMKFQGAKFVPVTTTEGYNVYGALATAEPLLFTVSGSAPLPQQVQSAAGAGGQTSGAEGGDGKAAAAAAATLPESAMTGIVPPKTWMENNRMGVLIVLVILAITCFAYLATRARPVAVAANPGFAPPAPVSTPAQAAVAAPGAASPAAPAPAAAPPAGLGADLARLKDELFLLEVRRQTGDIDEAGYGQARAALEARLRELRLR